MMIKLQLLLVLTVSVVAVMAQTRQIPDDSAPSIPPPCGDDSRLHCTEPTILPPFIYARCACRSDCHKARGSLLVFYNSTEDIWSECPTCKRFDFACGPPPSIPGANITLNEEPPQCGAHAFYTCPEGYSPPEPNICMRHPRIKIGVRGIWQSEYLGKELKCLSSRSCPIEKSMNLINARTTLPLGNTASPGQQISWECLEGYHMVGENTSTCQGNGSWSSKPPFCLLISEDILTCITIIIYYCEEKQILIIKIKIIFKPSPPGKITLFLPWAIGTPNDTRKISFYQNGTIADGIMPIKKCMFDFPEAMERIEELPNGTIITSCNSQDDAKKKQLTITYICPNERIPKTAIFIFNKRRQRFRMLAAAPLCP